MPEITSRAFPFAELFCIWLCPRYPAIIPTLVFPDIVASVIWVFVIKEFVILPISPPICLLVDITSILFPITFSISLYSAFLANAPTSATVLEILLFSNFKFEICASFNVSKIGNVFPVIL